MSGWLEWMKSFFYEDEDEDMAEGCYCCGEIKAKQANLGNSEYIICNECLDEYANECPPGNFNVVPLVYTECTSNLGIQIQHGWLCDTCGTVCLNCAQKCAEADHETRRIFRPFICKSYSNEERSF